VQLHESDILSNIAILEYVDAVHARAALSRALNARSPALSDGSEISLKQCRHPILSARFLKNENDETGGTEKETPEGCWLFDKPGVVEIDIIKPVRVNTLVITGANAGGKTVALKTLGLFALMYQSGLHLPIGPKGHIALFDNIFADIGDEQNIEARLSTFSAHMKRLKTVADMATERSLVLLDELGSGTDPSEGGALAMALLDYLRSLRCTTLVTSHLDLLKTYAHKHADIENVSVEFDPQTHRPMYRLIYGLPGFSNALSIARAIGIPESIMQAAAAYTGSADRQTADLIQVLEHTQRSLRAKNDELETRNQETSMVQKACQRLLDTMQKKRNSILKKFEDNSRALLQESETRLRSIIKQQRKLLRQQSQAHSENDALEQMQQVKQTLYSHFPPKPSPQDHVEDVRPGQKVAIHSLKKTGTVTAVDTMARRAEIDIGSMRVKAGFHELTRPGETNRIPDKHVLYVQQPKRPFEKQVNVIGMRVAEALPLIDKNIDTAIVQGADCIEIIHGRGTGRLMRAIHSHLQDHGQVARLICEQDQPGNSGVTRVELK
jgi:DNA mismatch repair protein MutS2